MINLSHFFCIGSKNIACFFKKKSCVNVTKDVKLLPTHEKDKEKKLLMPHYEKHNGLCMMDFSFFLSFFFIIASDFQLKGKPTQIVIRKANIDLVNRIRRN
jgi:hypothetical protein